MSEITKREQSLEDLPERVDGPLVLTPRSRLACDIEGIDSSSLVYRPLEEFVDKQLSPRLVKLRYDFFEAKRKDMLVLAKTARVKVIEERRGVHSFGSRETSSTSSSEWGILNLEREKLVRFQAEERKWLQNCLNREVHLLESLESEDNRLTAESHDSNEKLAQESRRIKELNDRRRVIEEQKQRVREAQQEIEKEEAKVAFAKRQAELDLVQERLAEKKKKQHLKSVKDAEMRKQKEAEKRRAQDQVWAEKLAALSSMEQADLDRLRILESCKSNITKRLHAKMSLKEKRVNKSIEKHKQIELQRKSLVLARFHADRDRDHRLAVSRSEVAEENAKKSLHLMVKRKIIQDESKRQLEVRRSDILAHQAEIDQRLQEHEQKRDRYLAFKLELESLREQNKRLNVERQRKKCMFLRNSYAAKVAEKDAKVEAIFSERQKLWDVRKKSAAVSQIARDYVKQSIMEMRIKSKIDPEKIKLYVDQVLNPHQKEEPLDIAIPLVFTEEPVDATQMVQVRPTDAPATPGDPPEPSEQQIDQVEIVCSDDDHQGADDHNQIECLASDSEEVPVEPLPSPVSPVRFVRAPELEFAENPPMQQGELQEEPVIQHVVNQMVVDEPVVGKEHVTEQVEEHVTEQVEKHVSEQVEEHVSEQVEEHVTEQVEAHVSEQVEAHVIEVDKQVIVEAPIVATDHSVPPIEPNVIEATML